MIGLIDTDILYKLTCCNLLNESLEYLEIKEHQTLDAALNIIRKKILKKKKAYGHDLPEVQNRLRETYDQAARIPDLPNDYALLAKMSAVPGIDPGEAVLLCSAIETGSAILISGDKRFYSSLANDRELMEVCSLLEGRLICLEHLLLCLVDGYQFPYVRQRVAPARWCDQTLQVAFSRDLEAEQGEVTSILVEYSKEVVTGLGALAYSHRPWYK